MSNPLRNLLENNHSGTPQLMIDAENYAQKVLLQDKAIPWHEATAYANHLGQTVALLKPKTAIVRLDIMIKQELADNQALVEAMGEKRRSGFALKAFMGNEDFRTAMGTLVTTVTKTVRLPLIFQLPSPLEMLYLTAASAQPDGDHDFDDDDAENAAVYFADWLRIFTDAELAGLIFDEREGEVADVAYQPIKNTAEHYRWCIGVRRNNEVIFSDPQATIPVLADDFWQSGEAKSDLTGSVFSEITKEAMPEKVLEFIATLN